MEFTLTRRKALKDKTTGVLYLDEELIGFTIEPSIAQYSHAGQVSAMAAGEYELEVRNNPSAGTPTIKIKGKYIPSNSSIRCCQPMGQNNGSIVLLNNPNNDGSSKTLDYYAWSRLLRRIHLAMMNKEEVTLKIKEVFNSTKRL